MAFRMSAGLEDPADRRHPGALRIEQQLRALVRYAALAPSTRNSQPWHFTIEGDTVRLWPIRAAGFRWQTPMDASFT